MKLRWFSPLPPSRSGIADYTADVLPALGARCELEAWTDARTWDNRLNRSARIRSFSPDDLDFRTVNDVDCNIYNLGNNGLFHQGIWEVARQAPGLVILHDTRLHHLFGHIYRESTGDRDGYMRQMLRYYGPASMNDAEQFWDGRLATEIMATRYPLTELAIENALGIVAHTRTSFDALCNITEKPVFLLPLAYAGKRHRPRRDREPPYTIILFGHLGPTRRVLEFLAAFAKSGVRNMFRIEICGQLWDSALVSRTVRSLDLERQVDLRGFLSTNELNDAFYRADLAVNLRYPDMGEASLSQLQLWDASLPTLVTNIGWYSEQPPEVVRHIAPDAEEEDLIAALRDYVKNPRAYREMGERARARLLSAHSPERYADAILDVIKQCLENRSAHCAGPLTIEVSKALVRSGLGPRKMQLESIARAIAFVCMRK